MEDKRRLLKDLPFELSKGTVLTHGNNGYYVEMGDTIYETGGTAHNGWRVLDEKEVPIIDLIWDKKEWFEPAGVDFIDIQAKTDCIIITFKPLDLGDAQLFARGIQYYLLHFGAEDNYAWNKFKSFGSRVR